MTPRPTSRNPSDEPAPEVTPPQPEPAGPTGPTGTPETAEAARAAEATEAAEAVETAKAAKKTGPPRPGKPPRPTKAPKSARPTKTSESALPAEAAESARPAGSAGSTGAAKAPAGLRGKKVAKTAKSAKSAKPTGTAKTPGTAKPKRTGATKPTGTASPFGVGQAAKSPKLPKSPRTPDPTTTTGATGTAAPPKPPKPAKTAEATAPSEPSPAVQDPATPQTTYTAPVLPGAGVPGGPVKADAPMAAGAGVSPVGPEDRSRLLAGTHHDPHGVLGAHRVAGGVAFRALRPYARSVTVIAGELRAELADDGDGFFSAVVPLRDVPADYRLHLVYDEATLEIPDVYAFLPALGEFDLHLIGEGRHERLWDALGARPMTHQGTEGTRFTVWAPNARGVRVVGNFNYWDGIGFPMRSLGGSGVWELFVPGVGAGELYKFQITRPDGSTTFRADPMARRTETPPANSSVVDVSRHEWRDEEWLRGRGDIPVHEAPFSVYEVHLPSWRPGLTYLQLAEQLPAYVADLGFTHVELMPVAEHPFGGSWGYQVTGFYAPTARLGTPDDFKHLVDALHQAGIGVLMDWVPAHFPRDDWALAQFDGLPLYEHQDPRRAAHPDWGTLEFDYGRKEVRNFLVANATYWCEEFHIDGLRVDAVASMLYLDYSREHGQWTPNEHGGRENLDAVAFLQEMNATVYRRCPGVVTIAEESTAWDGVTRATHHTGPGGFGGLGFGLKWNMGWMHDSLGYMAKEPVYRRHHHHEMTFSMVYAYSENYVLPISHDEVVHGKRSLVSKMPGDWWQQRANHRAYLAYMWAHPGKQLLFMGQEFAQGAEWSEGHGPDWWLLDPAYGAEAEHRGVRDLVRDLNTAYRALPALWKRDTDPAGFAWVLGDAAEDNVFAFLRFDAEGVPLLAVSHLAPVVRHEYRIGVPEEFAGWQEILNTDAARYGGSDVGNPSPLKPDPTPAQSRPASLLLTLPPLTTLWFRPT
ncbi:1,4-alpha-glucan branching enzyme [Streptomyces sp. NPDC017940]|uniref:1,4-alpha-glucan branching enzyme n=1 Tax=Streptomyces sp. NPDC017940 TaxID=3365017 RepID=UPI0037B50A3A